MRKENYALCVRGISPLCHHFLVYSRDDKRIISSYCAALSVDTQYIEAYLDLRAIEAAHGQGKKAGSQERGAGARRRAQSQSRRHPRRLVRRQSLLRREGPGPGPLRDGAAPPGRRHRNQRGGGDIRRHPADLLQGAERAADGWDCGSAAEPAGPEGRPQDLRRGDCLRSRSQSREPRADDFAMSRRDRGTLWCQGAPAQPGAGAGAQKKRLIPA